MCKSVEILNRVLKPEPEIPPWQWLEERVESIPYSPVSGGLDTGIDPIIRQVLDILTDPANKLVVIRCAVQRFKTLCLELYHAWKVVNDPAPSMFFQDIDANARDEMEGRLMPLFENTKGVKELIPRGADKDKAKKTVITLRNGMTLYVLGAENERNLQRRSMQSVSFDECWQLTNGTRSIKQGEARTTRATFPKVILASQGCEPDSGKGLEFTEYEATTDMRVEHVSCPECGESQPMGLDNFEFEIFRDEDGEYDFKRILPTAHFECRKCKAHWPDDDAFRLKLRQSSHLVATNLNASAGNVGIIANAFPYMGWAALCEEYLRGKAAAVKGNIEPLKTFYMKRLAQHWVDGGQDDFAFEIHGSGYEIENAEAEWNETRLIIRNGKIGIIPKRETNFNGTFRARSIVADVQQDCFYVGARSWTRDGRSRLLKMLKLHSWDEINELAKMLGVAPCMVFVDAGDKPNTNVYPFAAKYGFTCLKGDSRANYAHRVPPKKPGESWGQTFKPYSPIKPQTVGAKRLPLIMWSNLSIKDQLAKLLNMPDRWQIPDDIDGHFPEYKAHMDSERRGKSKTGKPQWNQIAKRPNHGWDVEAMQVVVGNILRILGGEVPETEAE